MAIWVPTENPTQEVNRWLRRWTDTGFADEQLARRHPSLTKQQRRTRAREVALHVTQGLEYVASSEASSVLTRPLPLFYAAENLAKALVIVATGTLTVADFRVHGLTGDKQRRYSMKNLRCRVAPAGRDVWSRVVAATGIEHVILRWSLDGRGLEGEVQQTRNVAAGAPGRELRLGELVKRMPELQRDVIAADWGSPHIARIESYSLVMASGPPETRSFSLRMDTMHDPGTQKLIQEAERRELRGFTKTFEHLNAIEYAHAGPSAPLVAVRQDLFGVPYADLGREIGYLSDIALHVAALFILSELVRYQPDKWKRLLDEHQLETVLVEHYLEIAARKVPNLVLNEMLGQCIVFRARNQ